MRLICVKLSERRRPLLAAFLPLAFFVPLMAAQQPKPSGPDFISYDPSFKATSVRIVPEAELKKTAAPFVVARLANGKLALMARGAKGKMEPFFIKAIETGFFDTRRRGDKTDFDEVFENYRKMGANVSLFMIHWGEVEPTEGQFDFQFADKVVATAKRRGLKIWWVFFMHEQGLPNRGRDFWAFNMDNRGSANYTVQWVKDEHGNIIDSMEKIQALRPSEVMPCYSHPKMFAYQNRVIRRIAQHYKDSDTVIGIQIGNEEGFIPSLPENRDSDFNPYTLKFYEDWKLKTGKSDWNAFKFNALAWWYRNFTTSFHAQDPYKLASFNLWGSFNEQGRAVVIRRTGADHTFYAQGNLDVVASMFYRKEARDAWPNLDSFYNYVYQLPILMPSEIGIGHHRTVGGSRVIFQGFALDAIERGSAGYSAYCYGQMLGKDGKPDYYAEFYGKLAAMVTANEDVLHPGVPGPGDVRISTPAEGMKVSQLHRGDGATVGILRFPDAAFDDKGDDNPVMTDVKVDITANVTGTHAISVYRDGRLDTSKSVSLGSGESSGLVLPDFQATEAVFIKVVSKH